MLGTICHLCSKRPATIHLTEVDDHGKVNELHCCAVCARRLDLDMQSDPPPIAEILSRNQGLQSENEQPIHGDDSDDNPTCAHCGLTWAEFLLRNRFGCAHDAEAFAHLLERALGDLQGARQHHGRLPLSGDSAQDLLRSQLSERLDLERQLSAAINDEAFERAAEIRDRIRALDGSPS